MKTTLLTLASIATLASVVNAQTLYNMSGSAPNAMTTSSGIDFTVTGDTPLVVTPSIFDPGVADDETWLAYGFENKMSPYIVVANGDPDGAGRLTMNFASPLPADSQFVIVDIDVGQKSVIENVSGASFSLNGVIGDKVANSTGIPPAWDVPTKTLYASLEATENVDFNAAWFDANGMTSITLVANSGEIGFLVYTVPEPSSTALLGLCALGLLVRRIR